MQTFNRETEFKKPNGHSWVEKCKKWLDSLTGTLNSAKIQK